MQRPTCPARRDSAVGGRIILWCRENADHLQYGECSHARPPRLCRLALGGSRRPPINYPERDVPETGVPDAASHPQSRSATANRDAAAADLAAPTASLADTRPRPRWAGGTLYPQPYLWYVFLSSMDVVFTWLILQAGGREVNAIADWILRSHDVRGIILLKFILLAFVVVVCEIVGRHNHATGLKLARWAVAISAFPVLVGAFHLLQLVLSTAEE